jgi:hypothetical protein
MLEPQPHETVWALSTAAVAGRCIQVCGRTRRGRLHGGRAGGIDALAALLGAASTVETGV